MPQVAKVNDPLKELKLQEFKERTFSLYPNPTQESLFVEMSNLDLSDRWSITNLEGRVIASGPITEQSFDLDVKNIADGIYIFIIKGDYGTIVEKLIKK